MIDDKLAQPSRVEKTPDKGSDCQRRAPSKQNSAGKEANDTQGGNESIISRKVRQRVFEVSNRRIRNKRAKMPNMTPLPRQAL